MFLMPEILLCIPWEMAYSILYLSVCIRVVFILVSKSLDAVLTVGSNSAPG